MMGFENEKIPFIKDVLWPENILISWNDISFIDRLLFLCERVVPSEDRIALVD